MGSIKKESVVEPILFQQPLHLARQTDIRLSTLTYWGQLLAGYTFENASVEGVGMAYWMVEVTTNCLSPLYRF